MHNDAGITDPVDTTLRDYYERPFLVLRAERFADACFAAISAARRRRPGADGVGAVDQWVDSTDVLSAPRRAHGARRQGCTSSSSTRRSGTDAAPSGGAVKSTPK